MPIELLMPAMAFFLSAAYAFMAALATATFLKHLPVKPSLLFVLGTAIFWALVAPRPDGSLLETIAPAAFLAGAAMAGAVTGALPVMLVLLGFLFWKRRRAGNV